MMVDLDTFRRPARHSIDLRDGESRGRARVPDPRDGLAFLREMDAALGAEGRARLVGHDDSGGLFAWRCGGSRDDVAIALLQAWANAGRLLRADHSIPRRTVHPDWGTRRYSCVHTFAPAGEAARGEA